MEVISIFSAAFVDADDAEMFCEAVAREKLFWFVLYSANEKLSACLAVFWRRGALRISWPGKKECDLILPFRNVFRENFI